ncbi:hypothetical protein [Tautonia marina]|uniref:hypothetical protein n=1 Tax=Tautonia marina TaxID=2653855 RepID=UPI0013760C96|nr:hypothetical protein [Tautonia marina]
MKRFTSTSNEGPEGSQAGDGLIERFILLAEADFERCDASHLLKTGCVAQLDPKIC